MPIFVRLPLSRRTACIDCDADGAPLAELTQEVARLEGIPEKCLALTCGGRRLTGATVTTGQWLTCVVTGLSGGKGGFGSMLRAIGAQIEKTTNREACRDLSGRRLRDINHETRLKRWVAKQAEREGQREQRKTPREPQHQLQDPEYERLREQIPERIQEAVTQGLAAGSKKRPAATSDGESSARKRPAAALWLPELPSGESSSDEDSESAHKSEGEKSPGNTSSSGEEDSPNVEPAATVESSPSPVGKKGGGKETQQQDGDK